MRNLALADLTSTDLAAMLAENETLFVEHKASISHEAYQVAKAICSFANTLGGWVLIGVTNGTPNAGQPDGWEPLAAAELTDRVREALKENRVDPIPAFAATVRHAGDERAVGIVRVYESADAPHVMGNGQVFVRSVAEDENRQRVYRPGGVETQAVLIQLADRGRLGESRATELLEAFRAPFLLRELGFQWAAGSGLYSVLAPGTVAIRAVPVTGSRLQDWAVSARAQEALEHALRTLVQIGDDSLVDQVVNISGLAAHIRGDLSLAGGRRHGIATVAVDTAGLVGASLLFGASTPPMTPERLTLNGFRDAFVIPLLDAVCAVLDDAELYGRSELRLTIRQMDQIAILDDAGGMNPVPADLPIGGEISLPLSDDRAEVQQLADQWRGDIGRAAGYPELR